MRFYLDEDLSPSIAEIARARGLDIVSVHECGRKGCTDEQQLSFAASEGRCLVTRDRDHFLAATIRFFHLGWPHCGVLVVPASMPSKRFAAVAAALLEFDRQHPEGVPAYFVDFLHRLGT